MNNNSNHTDLPQLFTVTLDDPETVEAIAAVAISDDTGLRLWTPILGPSAVLMARILCSEAGRTWHIADLAAHLGLSVQVAQRTLDRLMKFGWLTGSVDCNDAVTYRIRQARSVPARQLERLHPDIVDMHVQYLAGQQTA